MNKISILCFSLLYLFTSFFSYSDQVSINIKSKVVESTCIISSDSTDFVVNMVSTNLRGQDTNIPFGKSPFSITLDNCPNSINIANIKFIGDPDHVMPNLLKILDNNESSAKGIAIGLYDENNNIINISNNNMSYSINHDANKYTFHFSAAYVKTREDAVPGQVQAISYFDIYYD
ncbi:fimbrial protein [Providencia huaxiensis]|uniref:fimbrial protein n=1 Tax=Providencia TaxID=586 RepID=UPI00234AE780|nr:fimbrial protein [Providencia sp. PROV076]